MFLWFYGRGAILSSDIGVSLSFAMRAAESLKAAKSRVIPKMMKKLRITYLRVLLEMLPT